MSPIVFGSLVPCRQCGGRGGVRHEKDDDSARNRARMRRQGQAVPPPSIHGSLPALQGRRLPAAGRG